MNSQAVLDVVTLHCVSVLHNFASENQTQLFRLRFKLLRNKRFELQRGQKKIGMKR